MILFLGHPIEYWSALQDKASNLDVVDLIAEIATLRSKISFYEKRISELANFMKIKLEVKV